MAKVNLETFKTNAKRALAKKETHGIFKQRREKFETVPLTSLDEGMRLRIFSRDLEPLKRSIEKLGQLEPIIVRRQGDRYEILDGHRRVAVAKSLGHADIAAEVIEAEDKDALFLPYLLNAAESFDLIEIALYLRHLTHELGIDAAAIQEEIGLRVDDFKELFFERGTNPLEAFNDHFEGLLRRHFRIVKQRLDIEKNGVGLRLEVDEKADARTKSEVYRFIYRLSQL